MLILILPLLAHSILEIPLEIRNKTISAYYNTTVKLENLMNVLLI